MIKTILSNDSYQRINDKMNKTQRREWNNFKTELYQEIDVIRDKVRGLYLKDNNIKSLNERVNYLMTLISTIPTFEEL